MKPFVKWAGGKRQIIDRILPYIQAHLKDDSKYYEPFVGGGSVFLRLNQKNTIINDLNSELINCYRVIKTQYKKLIEELEKHQQKHFQNEEYFYEIREMDRDIELYKKMSNVEKAARTIYLNKTCYNGLYRVNKKGFFNTPKGKYKKPNIVDAENLKELYFHLRKNHIQIRNLSFEKSLIDSSKGDFVYFDPPYDYEDTGFTKYVKEGFGHNELILLKETCDNLIAKGVKVLISNNATKRVLSLFDDERYEIIDPTTGKTFNKLYKHEKIDVRRTINAVSNGDNIVKEVLIFGYREE